MEQYKHYFQKKTTSSEVEEVLLLSLIVKKDSLNLSCSCFSFMVNDIVVFFNKKLNKRTFKSVVEIKNYDTFEEIIMNSGLENRLINYKN